MITLMCSLLLPVALMIASSIHYEQPSILGNPRSVLANWLYMGFPQLLWGFLAVLFVRTFSRIRVVTLLAFDGLLICFQLCIWYAVDRRDGADAWILYIPLWLLVLIVASSVAWIGARRQRRL